MTGFGLGWVNPAADYSRSLPRRASSAGVIGWTTIGSSVAPIVLLVFGLLLAGSSSSLSTAIGPNPIGVRAPRFVAALIDGTVMVGGTIYVVFFPSNFVGQFEGFLTTLGVPIAAWCGIMLADIALRRRDYAESDLYNPKGRYGDIRLFPIAVIVVGP